MVVSRLKEGLAVLLLIISCTLHAQIVRIDTITNTKKVNLKSSQFSNQRLYMYTIGVKAYSLEEFPKILNRVDNMALTNTAFSGLFLKLNDNQISYRISANFYKDNITFRNECQECEEAKGKVKDFSTKIGFEKNFIYGKVQPYLAFDLGYRRNSFEGSVKNATTSLNYTQPYDVTTLKNGFLLSPNFGFKFSPVSHFTFAIETGIGLLYSYEKQERVYTDDPARTRTFDKFKKWEFLLKPVSVASIQYNFGLAY